MIKMIFLIIFLSVLNVGERYIHSHGRHHALIIEKVHPDDEGLYTCQTVDSRASTQAYLLVMCRELKFITSLRDVCVMEGEQAVFEAEMSEDVVSLIKDKFIF